MSIEKINNILIINGENHEVIGGTENYTYKLIKIFTNLGHNVYELNLKNRNITHNLKNYENINHKINLINKKSMFFFLFIPIYFINFFKFNFLIHRIWKNKKIDIIIDNTQNASYVFFKNKKKLIWIMHNDVVKIHREQKSFWNKIRMFIALRMNRFNFNKVVVFSKKDKDWILKNIKKSRENKILVCPLAHKNYEELNIFDIQEKINQAKNIVYMGRLDQAQKNINFIAKISEELNNNYICIYGDGPDKNIILNKPGIKYEGSFKKEEVDKILKKAKLLILPSFFEGFPYVIVEALSNGVPCLVANTFNNASYLVNELRGECINNFDVNYWVKKIIYFNNLNKETYIEYCKNSIEFSKKNLLINNFENFWLKIVSEFK